MKKGKFITPLLLSCFLSIAIFISSCSNNDPVTTAGGQKSASVSMMATTTANNQQGLTITGAKFLVEFVKLETARGHDAADLKEGPFVVTIDLTGTRNVIAVSNVPNGTFNEVHFKIHKHTPNEVVIDPDFGTGSVGYSGIITGTYNGVPFTYRTAITASEEVDIDPPMVVPSPVTPLGNTSGVSANVDLIVDPSVWFVVNDRVLNPMDLANIHNIDESIKTSFKQAFDDDNCDGHPDHHGH